MNTIPACLAHLPVVDRLPVPYVACWTGEQLQTGVEQWRQREWLRTELIGVGRPDFGSTNSFRQREGMRHGRCQICGRKGADVWVIPNDEGAGEHTAFFVEQGWVYNPPLHRECYEASRSLCPHLRRIEPFAVFERDPATMPIEAWTYSIVRNGLRVAIVVERWSKLGPPGAYGRELILGTRGVRR